MLIRGSVYKRVPLFAQICLTIAALLFAGCAAVKTTRPATEDTGPVSIEAIKVTSFGGETTVVEVVNSMSVPYTTFRLIDPLRLILDIRAVPGKNLQQATEVNDGNVTDIRVEKGETQAVTTRIVVGMARPGDYQVAEKDNAILLTFVPKKAALEKDGEQKAFEPQETIEPKEPRIFFKPGALSLNQVLGVDFTMLDHGRSRLNVTTDKKVQYNLERKGPKTLVLILEETAIPPLLLRRLDSSEFDGAVEQVKPIFSSEDKRLSLAISLREMVPLHVDQTDSVIHVDFGPTSFRPPEKKIIPVKLVQAEKPAPTAGETAAGGPVLTQTATAGNVPLILGKPKYRGPNMTMDFSNAEVTNVLRLIGDVSNLNIIWGPDVKGNVSMRLKNVPWEQALDLILMNNNLGKIEEGNIVWVAPKTKIDQIRRQEQQRRETKIAERRKLEEEKKAAEQAKKEVQPLVTEYLRVDFADASTDILPHLEKIKSERGTISVDARTNTLIMTDIAENIEKARKIRSEFDTPVKQIMIEARIVEATTNLVRDLGIEWGIVGERRNNAGVAFDNFDSTTYGAGGDRLWGASFDTNSPAGWISNIGLAFGRLTSTGLGALMLDAQLALAETEGKTKIISAPKVIASNGESATISRGSTFYLPAAENVEAKEVTAELSLEVTPNVSFNDFVSMEITVKDEQQTGSSGKRGKDLSTKLMVKSGETIVIGGIYSENESFDNTGIPWMKDIPILGWLFGAEHKTFEKAELLIFLTPTVLPPPNTN
ncbi:MAG: type IV pilus secretin PilQ [Deltaproteobacteria bacterium]|nr:type IV pilus secretin PilQ [Deltaproteobacteria bacterium]MBW2119135.1 type IV pilus secretin PilQ [Deltaproteobacteria bacterium]MBW2345250.1 type IV pilus secretin PilQ [Deltaproteobacteria bacterium]